MKYGLQYVIPNRRNTISDSLETRANTIEARLEECVPNPFEERADRLKYGLQSVVPITNNRAHNGTENDSNSLERRLKNTLPDSYKETCDSVPSVDEEVTETLIRFPQVNETDDKASDKARNQHEHVSLHSQR